MPRKQCENWCLNISNLLSQESLRMSPSNSNSSNDFTQTDSIDKLSFQRNAEKIKASVNLHLESVEFCVNQDFVMATVGQEKFKLRPNNLNSIFIAAVITSIIAVIIMPCQSIGGAIAPMQYEMQCECSLCT